jgi:hypothetical protein
LDETTVGILQELESNALKGQRYTMFTEFTKNDRRPLSAVIESIDRLLDAKLVAPRFSYPGMERISITLTPAGQKVLSDAAAKAAEETRRNLTA